MVQVQRKCNDGRKWNDICVYGIPYAAKSIVKIDPTKPATTSTIGEEAEKVFLCDNGVLGGGGYIYAANMYGQVLQIDTTIIITQRLIVTL